MALVDLIVSVVSKNYHAQIAKNTHAHSQEHEKFLLIFQRFVQKVVVPRFQFFESFQLSRKPVEQVSRESGHWLSVAGEASIQKNLSNQSLFQI